MAPDWFVESIEATGEAYYRLRVVGQNLNYPEGDKDRRFTWRLRDVDDPRFDLSGAAIDPAAVPYLGREVASCGIPDLRACVVLCSAVGTAGEGAAAWARIVEELRQKGSI